MNNMNGEIVNSSVGSIESNKVLKNTFALLGMTIAFSALTAVIAAATSIPMMPWWLTLIGYFGLLFLTEKNSNNSSGLFYIFSLTGFMGLTLGPMLSMISGMPGGSQSIMLAFSGTAMALFGLSGYAMVSKKDFSFLGGMLTVGILIAFVGAIVAILFSIPALSLATSAMFVLLSSGLILWQVSDIIHGGETNYISATVTLFVSTYNIFVSMLHLIMSFSGDD